MSDVDFASYQRPGNRVKRLVAMGYQWIVDAANNRETPGEHGLEYVG